MKSRKILPTFLFVCFAKLLYIYRQVPSSYDNHASYPSRLLNLVLCAFYLHANKLGKEKIILFQKNRSAEHAKLSKKRAK